MKDPSGMLQKAPESQKKAPDTQSEAAATLCEGNAGAGMVTVSMTARGELRGVKVDPSLFKPEEAEIVEDLLVAAHADARREGEAFMADKMSEITAGLPLPPGMKVPF